MDTRTPILRKRAFAHNGVATISGKGPHHRMDSTATRKPRKTNIEKDTRKYRLSHLAFLYFQALAHKEGLEPGAFLETISRQLAQERLTVEQRAQLEQEAERITAERRRKAEEQASTQTPVD